MVEDADYAVESVFELRPCSTLFTQQEMQDVMNSIKGRSAPCWDFISAKVAEDNFNSLLPPFLHVINLCTRTGQFPIAYKIAKVFQFSNPTLKDPFLTIGDLFFNNSLKSH